MARSMIVSYILYPGSQDVPVRVRAVRNPKALGRDDNAICQGRRVSADTVGDLLRAEGFSLQGNAKTLEGQRHPDRDAQFRYINQQVKAQSTSRPAKAGQRRRHGPARAPPTCFTGSWMPRGNASW